LAVLAAGPEVFAAGKAEDAKKYTNDLKTSADPKVRAKALRELGELGQVMRALVEPALPDIEKALEDQDPAVRAAAAEAFGKTDPDPAKGVPMLVKLTKDSQPEMVRLAAVRGLAAMGPNAKSAAPEMRKLMAADPEKMSKLYREAMNAQRAINPKKQ
jgi:HEAT repeat protein